MDVTDDTGQGDAMSSRARACAALLLGSLLVPAGATTASPAGAAAPRHCASQSRIDVPHAPMQQVDCLDDLTTAGTVATGHTDASDWAGLNAPGTRNPSGVPGLQVDGYFPDDSTSNTHHGWDHDSQFVIRLPDDWNGGWSSAGPPAPAPSTPATSCSATGCSRAATPTR